MSCHRHEIKKTQKDQWAGFFPTLIKPPTLHPKGWCQEPRKDKGGPPPHKAFLAGYCEKQVSIMYSKKGSIDPM